MANFCYAFSVTPFFLFAHGAGAPSGHPWMRHWSELLRTVGPVETFDYPYIRAGRKYPDPLPKLVAAHREAFDRAREIHRGPPVLIGKSMGSRVGCHLAAEAEVEVAALVCFGYPLCAGGDRTKLRDKVLLELSTPTLFLQGTRDPLCPLELLEIVRAKMKAWSKVHVVEGGDHSLSVTKRDLAAAGKTQATVDQEILQMIRSFVTEHAAKFAR